LAESEKLVETWTFVEAAGLVETAEMVENSVLEVVGGPDILRAFIDTNVLVGTAVVATRGAFKISKFPESRIFNLP
jgi:hypothetical protein